MLYHGLNIVIMCTDYVTVIILL